MVASLTTYDAALKENYGPGLRNALNNSNPIVTECSRNDEDIVGREAVWAVHTGRSTSSGYRAELGTLPTAQSQQFTQAKEDITFGYHTITVSGPAIAATVSDTGAFVRALDREMRGAENDLKNDFARQLMGQKVTINSALQSGSLLGVSDAVTGTSNATFAFTGTDPTTSEFRPLFVGESVDVIATADGSTAGTSTVASYDSGVAKTVTLAAAVTTVNGATYHLVRAGNLNAEVNGLRHLINTSQTFAGINPTTVPTWKSVSVGTPGTTKITETVFDQAIEGVETDGDGSSPSLYIAEHSQRRALASLLQTQKRYDGRETTLKAGWRGLQIAQGTLVAERYCPVKTAFAITPSEISRFVMQDWDWEDRDGNVLQRSLTQDAVEARFKVYHQFVATNRNSHAVIGLANPPSKDPWA